MSKLLSPVDWLWVNCFIIKGQCCMFLNEWMNCLLWYVLFRRLYTVLPCIYELKCFNERCSDVCCFNSLNQKGSEKVREILWIWIPVFFFCLKDCNHMILLLALPLTLHNTSCIKAAIQCITAHCFYVHCHLNVCCVSLGQCYISQIGINKDSRAFCCLLNYINGCCA